MDEDLHVECHAGQRGEETPRRFRLGARRVEVVEVVDRWLGEDHRYFRVLGDDGNGYILRHHERAGRWQLTQFVAGGQARPLPRADSGTRH